MAKIAFLGVGMMGTPMARHLIDAGHDLIVWDRTPTHTDPFAPSASIADTAAAAVPGADFVITMLATPQALEDVVFGTGGVAAAITPGQVWIDMSTVGPQEFLAAAGRLPDGVVSVDAPVRGSVLEATSGRLHIFVGAPDEVFAPVASLLAPLGDIRHVGPPGSGAAMKLVVNLALVGAMVTFGESLALGQVLGLDQAAVMDVLAESPIGPIVGAKRANVETTAYPPSFKLELAAKDIALVKGTAAAAGLRLPTATAAGEWMNAAVAEGAGELDFSAVATTILSALDHQTITTAKRKQQQP
jgi:3-hydroxyisobutyrate dehydrogenase-like beta-hydroxyacid dehydrogenase